MKTITRLASEGRITNQIPDMVISFDPAEMEKAATELRLSLEDLYKDGLIYFAGFSRGKGPCKCGLNPKGRCAHMCWLSKKGIEKFADALWEAVEAHSKLYGFRIPTVNTKESYINAMTNQALV